MSGKPPCNSKIESSPNHVALTDKSISGCMATYGISEMVWLQLQVPTTEQT